MAPDASKNTAAQHINTFGPAVNVQNNNNVNCSPIAQRRSGEKLKEAARNQALFKAAGEGQTRRVEHLISQGADADHTDDDGLTALHYAAGYGCDNTAEVLIKQHHVDINALSKLGGAPLRLAARNSRVRTVDFLIASGAKINPAGEFNGSALMGACDGGDLSIVKRLVSAGASTDSQYTMRYGSGKTHDMHPLHEAVWSGHESVARYLLEQGVNVDAHARVRQSDVTTKGLTKTALPAIESERITALMFAAMRGRQNLVRLLIEQRADINARDSKGRSSLLLSATRGHLNCVVLLLDSGADMRINRDLTHQTPMVAAARNGRAEVLKLLLDRGADISNVDRCSALTLAGGNGHVKCVQLMLEHGADVNYTDNDEKMALHRASRGGHIATTQALLQQGADPTLKDKKGRTAYEFAKREGHKEMQRILKAAGKTRRPKS